MQEILQQSGSSEYSFLAMYQFLHYNSFQLDVLVTRCVNSTMVKSGMVGAGYRSMIKSLSIDGYRAFSRFQMSGLGQINLLVGRNNSGKTSVLEALYLLGAGGDPSSLWRVITRRGERIETESASRSSDVEADLCHLFLNHDLNLKSSISISSKNGSPPRSLTFKIKEAAAEEGSSLFQSDPGGSSANRIVLEVSGTPTPPIGTIPLSRLGGLRADTIDNLRRPRAKMLSEKFRAAQWISTESVTPAELSSMWDDIVLTESEEKVLEALRFIEPKIERVAAISNSTPPLYASFFFGSNQRGGFKVKLRDIKQPIPIGSFGDGIWRMLAMAIALIRSKAGILLIDEIDTGLHYSVMADMWRLIYQVAKEFDIQVFATTHSYDCVQSLSSICMLSSQIRDAVTIQRIERAEPDAIRYTESEIRIAAERKIEVR